MKINALIVLPAVLLWSSTAMADRYKQINHVIDASDLEKVHLEISVGEVDIEIYDGEEIQLEIDIESDRGWFTFGRGHAEDVELDIEGSGPRVYIGITERNIEQHWRVKLPAKLALELDMGVGDIHIEDFANSLDLELGVGAVRVDVADVDYDAIHASVGVGDSTIRGFSQGMDNERNFISADSYYHGEGEFEMQIEVGVGDVEIRKN